MQQKIFKGNKVEYYCAALALQGVSNFFKANLFEYFKYDIEAFWNCTKSDMEDFCKKFPDVRVSRTFFSKKKEINPALECENAHRKGYKILTFDDDLYPDLLREIPDFPLALYYKGELSDVNFKKTLAVVGSRKASTNAKESLASIISQMQNTDVTIVSGLAWGIDARAHECAIKNNLPTIAVIGSGLDFEYPSSNKHL